jgi:hypothetical protein
MPFSMSAIFNHSSVFVVVFSFFEVTDREHHLLIVIYINKKWNCINSMCAVLILPFLCFLVSQIGWDMPYKNSVCS